MPFVILVASLSLASPCLAQDSRALRADLGRLWQEQRYDDLLRRVRSHLADSPEAADLWIMAAEAALKIEDFPRAVESFERGVKLRPSLRAAAINVGFAYLKVDRLADARRVFESFTRDADKARAAKAHYGLGLALAAANDPEGAKKAFAESARLDASDPRPQYRLGQLALEAGDARGAIPLFLAALEGDELHRGAAYGLARAHGILGDAAASTHWADRHRQILETDDAVTMLIRKLGEPARSTDPAGPVEQRLQIALRLVQGRAPRRAAFWFKAVLVMDPSNDQARRGLAATPEGAGSRK
jgi:tetratricopeptide (TPR) repeat protein